MYFLWFTDVWQVFTFKYLTKPIYALCLRNKVFRKQCKPICHFIRVCAIVFYKININQPKQVVCDPIIYIYKSPAEK